MSVHLRGKGISLEKVLAETDEKKRKTKVCRQAQAAHSAAASRLGGTWDDNAAEPFFLSCGGCYLAAISFVTRLDGAAGNIAKMRRGWLISYSCHSGVNARIDLLVWLPCGSDARARLFFARSALHPLT